MSLRRQSILLLVMIFSLIALAVPTAQPAEAALSETRIMIAGRLNSETGIENNRLINTNTSGEDVQSILHGTGWSNIEIDPINEKAYWTVSGTLSRANLDGSGGIEDVGALITNGSSFGYPIFDQINQKLYVTGRFPATGTTNHFIEFDVNTSTFTSFTFPTLISGVAVDFINGKIYWTAVGELYRDNLNGGNFETITPVNVTSISHLDFDPIGERLYARGNDGIANGILIYDVNTDQIVDRIDGINPQRIELDPLNQKIYWTLSGDVYSSNYDGSGQTTVNFNASITYIGNQLSVGYVLPIPPTFTSSPAPDGTLGESYNHTFTADGDEPIAFSVTAGDLPDGITLSGSTISGTPTLAGDFSGTITATNAEGTDTQDFDITIGVPPSITSSNPDDGVVGVGYTHDFTATGNTPISYDVTNGALPDGLSISGSQITGTPTVGGFFDGEVTATNAFGTDTQPFEITIAIPPTFTSYPAPDGVLDEFYSHTLSADGDDTIVFSVTNGALPDGVSLSGDEISGMPTVGGTFTGEFTATNDAGTDTQAFSIFIATPPTFTSAAPPDGTINVTYEYTLTADGDAPITYTVTNGDLPDGLSISGDTIVGLPITGGTFSGELTASNDVGEDTQDFSITIGVPPSITSAAPPDGVVGTPYSHTFTADGTAPVSFSVSDGTLPPGVTLMGATLSGTPTTGGDFSALIEASNAYGTDDQDITITITVPPTITSAAPPSGTIGVEYTHTLTADGDTPITFNVTSGALPSGLSLSGDTISGTPDMLETATGEITATNASGTDVQAFSITINPDNTAPVANDDSYAVVGGLMLDIAATGVLNNDTDVDMDSLTAVLETDVTQGTLALNSDGSFTYTPDFGVVGTDTFTYFANDGSVNSDSAATVTITISDPAGTPPRLYPYNGETVNADSYQGPNFVFRHIAGVEWYQIWVGTDTDTTPVTQAYFQWHPATNAAPFAGGQGICDTGTNLCTIPGDIWIGDGNYSWWMTTWEAGDTTADINAGWNETKFTFEFGAPTNSFLLTTPADGSTVASAPTEFVWDHDPNVHWYQIWIGSDDYTNQILFNWYDTTEICEDGVCTLPVPGGASFGNGGYEGWAQEWGPGGYATWPMTPNTTFTVDSSGAVPMQQPVPRMSR